MRRFAATCTAVLLGLTACSDPGLEDTDRDESGEIAEEGDVGVMRLRLGDCLVVPDSMLDIEMEVTEVTEVTDFGGVPCSMTHNGEVVLNDLSFYDDYSDDWP